MMRQASDFPPYVDLHRCPGQAALPSGLAVFDFVRGVSDPARRDGCRYVLAVCPLAHHDRQRVHFRRPRRCRPADGSPDGGAPAGSSCGAEVGAAPFAWPVVPRQTRCRATSLRRSSCMTSVVRPKCAAGSSPSAISWNNLLRGSPLICTAMLIGYDIGVSWGVMAGPTGTVLLPRRLTPRPRSRVKRFYLGPTAICLYTPVFIGPSRGRLDHFRTQFKNFHCKKRK